MIFGFFTLVVALAVAGVAAWFSIVGLMAIFSASAHSIAIMAGALEIAKLVTASWLYRNWRVAGFLQKLYLTIAVLALMMITSMGIFGYLSRAHLEQQAEIGSGNTLQISQLQRRIDRETQTIQNAEGAIAQLDSQIDTLVEYDKISGPTGAVAVRQSQEAERRALDQAIQGAYSEIERLEAQLLPLQKQLVDLEVELGPLKYVAQLVYGRDDQQTLDQAARLFIILLVLVFDPLAVMLVVAANQSLMRHGIALETLETPLETPHEATPQDQSQPPQADFSQQQQEFNHRLQALEASVAAREPEIQQIRVPVEVTKFVDREVPVEVERVVERLVEKKIPVFVNSDGEIITEDLDAAVDLWIQANPDSDLDAAEVRQAFSDNASQLKNPQGFWAIPLPRSDRKD